VRYGNVLGSRGSVVPLYLKLLAEGARELPLTDPRMTRFWISLSQGVDFVLNCFERMNGGETFIPKIPSMRMVDLITAIAPEAAVRHIGLRPGEKLHEVLCPGDLSTETLEFADHYVIEPSFYFVGRPDYALNAKKEKGVRVAEGFEYNSFNNPHYLGMDELRAFCGR
jgi:UDP-N-acetylglucosamine 4,6-dehydratase